MTLRPEKSGIYKCSYCGHYEISGYCDYCENCFVEYETLIGNGLK